MRLWSLFWLDFLYINKKYKVFFCFFIKITVMKSCQFWDGFVFWLQAMLTLSGFAVFSSAGFSLLWQGPEFLLLAFPCAFSFAFIGTLTISCLGFPTAAKLNHIFSSQTAALILLILDLNLHQINI